MMNIFDNPLSPIAPYAKGIKLGLSLVAGLALLALVWSWNSRGQEIDRLEGWQVTVVNAATLATVKPDKHGKRQPIAPEAVPAAIQALSASLTSAEGTLSKISEGTLARKAASDAADKALNRQIEIMQGSGVPAGWNPWGDQK